MERALSNFQGQIISCVKWMQRSKDLWLKLEDVNVILVTWSSANRYIYSTAVADTPLVARQTTIFLYYLAKLNGIDLFADADFTRRIHFVGHSLGAHVAGFVGKDLGGRLGRITGLDPAGPSFDRETADKRLSRTDALLVDVIHTNAGRMHYANAVFAAIFMVASKVPFLGKLTDASNANIDRRDINDSFWYGFEEPLGHLDFYANDGRSQPGCTDPMHLCDHSRAHEIYEQILTYELELKRYSLTRGESRLANRLLAFSSQSYESFEIGDTFLRGECAKTLLEFAISTPSGADESIEEPSACAVPLDMLTPVDELREELASKYAVSLDGQNVDAKRYYFKTQAEEPLLGDHYLLKLQLDKRVSAWSSACKLEAEISVRSGGTSLTTQIKLKNATRLVDNDTFFGIVLPFVHPRGPDARYALNNLAQNLREAPNKVTAYEVAPSSVKLRISEVKKAQTLVDEIKMKLSSLFRHKKSAHLAASTECSLFINSVEISPVGSGLVFVYGRRGSSGWLELMKPESQYRRRVMHELSAAPGAISYLSDISLEGIVM